MICILRRVKELLSGSVESDWAALTPVEVIVIIDRELKSLVENHRLLDKMGFQSLFLPTAEIQEIAMKNGWSSDYLLLSSNFDDAILKL